LVARGLRINMFSPIKRQAIEQIDFLRDDCKRLLDEMFAICPADSDGHYPSAFRIVATPFLYAVWERCFRTSFGIMAMVVRQEASHPAVMSFEQATLWLQRESFVTSFIAKLHSRTSNLDGTPTRKSINSGSYRTLVEFLSNLIGWHNHKLQNIPLDSDLVMTFSNVNVAVLDANAQAIGLSLLPEFVEFRKCIGRLDDLVGRRNDIGHGTLASPPGAREFKALSELVSDLLVSKFCEVVQTWILYK
jgi:hypothetical protein